MRTTAVREGDEYVISGCKTFISSGLTADLVIVVCKTDPAAGAKGISLIVVETNRAGFRRGRKLDKLDKLGQYAQDTAELFFAPPSGFPELPLVGGCRQSGSP